MMRQTVPYKRKAWKGDSPVKDISPCPEHVCFLVLPWTRRRSVKKEKEKKKEWNIGGTVQFNCEEPLAFEKRFF